MTRALNQVYHHQPANENILVSWIWLIIWNFCVDKLSSRKLTDLYWGTIPVHMFVSYYETMRHAGPSSIWGAKFVKSSMITSLVVIFDIYCSRSVTCDTYMQPQPSPQAIYTVEGGWGNDPERLKKFHHHRSREICSPWWIQVDSGTNLPLSFVLLQSEWWNSFLPELLTVLLYSLSWRKNMKELETNKTMLERLVDLEVKLQVWFIYDKLWMLGSIHLT